MDQIAPQLERILQERDFFLRREVVEAGYDDRTIAQLVRRRVWKRIRTGAFVPAGVWDGADFRQRHILTARALQLASDLKDDKGGEQHAHERKMVLSHVTSAVILESSTFGMDLDHVHATREDRRGGRHAAGVRRHRSRVPKADCTETDGLRHTSPARVVIEILSLAGLEPALCVGNDLLHRKLTTVEEISAFADRAVNWPGTLTAKMLLPLLDPRRESVGESRFGLLSFRRGLPIGEPQHEVWFDGRLLGRVDVAYPEFGVFVEFDGNVKYGSLRRPGESVSDVVLREKRRQERICAATGWECIRITWADLARPAETADRIRAALERGRARMAIDTRSRSTL